MAEQSFLDLKPKLRKIREKLLLCNKWLIRFLMVGMKKMKLVKMNYTPTTVGASRGRKKQFNITSTTNRPNPPNARKEAEKAAAGKQRSKGLIHASNQSDEKRDNPEAASLPGELPKKVRHDQPLI